MAISRYHAIQRQGVGRRRPSLLRPVPDATPKPELAVMTEVRPFESFQRA